MNDPGPPRLIIVCGVSGAGKTTLGRALAAALSWEFADADDYHPPANIAKMKAGRPLDDSDRAPWLEALRPALVRRDRPLVLACSALKKSHRALLGAVDEGARGPVALLFLDGPRELIAARLADRAEHYMPPALLDSQLAVLEPPSGAVRINIQDTTSAQVAAARIALDL